MTQVSVVGEPLIGAAPGHSPAPGAWRGGATVVQSGETRSARIESLRAVAALGVLCAHILGQGVSYGPQATSTYAASVVFGGGLGVVLFFSLSGYLLYRPFARRDLDGGGAVDLRRYAVNRALRILPLYYACLAVWLSLSGRSWGAGDIVRFLTFSETWFPSTVSQVDGPMWSLCCEVEFYVLLPVVAVGVARLSRGNVARATAVLALSLLALYALREATAVGSPPAAPTWRYSLPANAVFFLPGMILAACEPELRRRVARWPSVLQRSTVWILAAIGLWLYVFQNYEREAVMLTACFVLLAGCVLPLRPGVLTAALGWRPLALLGVASYSLYLWHLPIVSRFPAGSTISDALRIGAVAVPLCVAIAVASYLLIEAPWLRLRRRWA